MSRTVSCIKCNTPFVPGSHFCHVCGRERDVPECILTLAGPTRRDHVARPGTARRKPSLPLAVLAVFFPKVLEE